MRFASRSRFWLKSRMPARTDCTTVFNIVLFVVYGWSIRGFLFELPSFSLYFHMWDLSGIIFYMFAFALLESIIVTVGLVIAGIVLPANWFKEGFAYKGFLVILVSTAAAILFQYYYKIEIFQDLVRNDSSSTWPLLEGFVAAVFVLAALLWFFRNNSRSQDHLLALAEQFRIFAYIYVPLGLIGLMVVAVRNI